ncbi:MAG: KEOPS complex subunit Cgi121 [Methanobacteriota archaeon]
MIQIIGAKGTIPHVERFLQHILSVAQQNNVVIQVMDAKVVYGKNHVLSAATHAIRAMKQKRNTTKSLAMELLLYASGERQIKLGIKKMGVTKRTQTIALVIIQKMKGIPDAQGSLSNHALQALLKTIKFSRDDKVLEGDADTLKRFGITTQEITTVPSRKYGDLILEKVAMVDVIK